MHCDWRLTLHVPQEYIKYQHYKITQFKIAHLQVVSCCHHHKSVEKTRDGNNNEEKWPLASI